MTREVWMPNDAMERLQQVAALHDVFVRILGHELRTPLSSVVYAARMIAARPEDLQGTRRRADQIERTARALDRLIEHVLALAQASTEGALPLSCEPTDLDSLVRRCLAELGPESSIRVSVAANGDTVGVWDHRRLAHVVSNLVTNALEHGEAGGLVRVELDGSDAARVRLSVHNRGTIAEEALGVLFEPFKARRRMSSGVGLGLYVVHCFVRAHWGDVQVTSNAEHGTEFRVELPRTRADGAAADGAEPHSQERPRHDQ
ncbi:MAG TPA: HAMP domain-containing sensor histidine kinase [Polyangiaceae bacterium]|nr:HAMP domain-containing sensor histidine kinase [Polyangiaceae bacterium]